MAIESVKNRINNTTLDGISKEDLVKLLSSLVDGLQAVMAKLDADAGVTDTNYGTTLAGYVID